MIPATQQEQFAAQPILSVRNLRVALANSSGRALVDGISFDLRQRGILGIVGESGCGKSLSALSILQLVPPTMRLSGHVIFEGEDILVAPPTRMREIRGNEIAMIFQDPMTSLNPVFTVGDQIVEAITTHSQITRRQARGQAIDILAQVGIPSPQIRIDSYPHQMSGGMRQRVMIAMALACKPKILVADEPTTALDVTIQAQILDLLHKLRTEFGMAIIIITHDLGVVADLADDIIVMYAGRVVESAHAQHLFSRPAHPYTNALLRSVAPADKDLDRIPSIPGIVPSPGLEISGCRFAPRCQRVLASCREAEPELMAIDDGHEAACINPRGYNP